MLLYVSWILTPPAVFCPQRDTQTYFAWALNKHSEASTWRTHGSDHGTWTARNNSLRSKQTLTLLFSTLSTPNRPLVDCTTAAFNVLSMRVTCFFFFSERSSWDGSSERKEQRHNSKHELLVGRSQYRIMSCSPRSALAAPGSDNLKLWARICASLQPQIPPRVMLCVTFVKVSKDFLMNGCCFGNIMYKYSKI